MQLDHMVSDAQKVYTGLYAERMAAFVATGLLPAAVYTVGVS